MIQNLVNAIIAHHVLVVAQCFHSTPDLLTLDITNAKFYVVNWQAKVIYLSQKLLHELRLFEIVQVSSFPHTYGVIIPAQFICT
jgi:hypothetical protein